MTREGLSLGEDNEEMGWVKEPNGPNSAYWRGIKRLNKSLGPKTLLKTSGTKQVGPIPLPECRRPGLEQRENHRRAFFRPPTAATLPCAGGLLEVPLDDFGVWFTRYFRCSLSLSWWKRIFVYFWRCGRNLGQIIRELPKVSEVATNYWVFLRCDWSPVSS